MKFVTYFYVVVHNTTVYLLVFDIYLLVFFTFAYFDSSLFLHFVPNISWFQYLTSSVLDKNLMGARVECFYWILVEIILK